MSPAHPHALELQSAGPAFAGLQVGVDSIEIADVEAAIRQFGDRYLERVYTAGERAYALAAPALTSARLAARFAAKEAAIKALNLGEAGISWKDIEVLRSDDGACRVALHGRAADRAASASGLQTALSLSHDSTRAVAVLVCMQAPAAPERPPNRPHTLATQGDSI
jgi:holo-[acyl-carrier protein] synthase